MRTLAIFKLTHESPFVIRDLDAPLEGGAGDREVLQASLDEARHLVEAALGADEARVLRVMLEQAVRVAGEAEEVARLLPSATWPPAGFI